MGRRGAATLASFFFFTACEGESNRGDTTDFDPDGGPRAEAGPRDLGAPDAEFVGLIYAFDRTYLSDGGIVQSYAVTAGFAETPTEVCSDRTPLFTGGDCTAAYCLPRTPDPPDGGSRPSAGQIMLTGGMDSVYLFLLPGGLYQPWVIRRGSLFNGGETLTANAEGAEVEAFSIQVTAPERATLTSPALSPPAGELTISRNQPLMLSWSGATRGKIRFSMSVLELSARTAIECTFPATDNAATLSRELLSTLPGGSGFYELRLEETAELEAGMYKVSLTAATNVVDPASIWAHGTLVAR